ELLERLKKRYDGYCFSSDLSVKVYNPFSLICAMEKMRLDAYWFATGTPNFLVEVLNHSDFLLDRLTTEEQTAEALDAIDAMYSNPIPLFFQSGYLTIKGYDPEFRTYSLDFPNTEVEQGFAQFMTNYYYGGNHNGGFSIRKFVKAVEAGEAETFMTLLQAFYADEDYQLVGALEKYFQNSLLMLFKLMGFYVQVERHTSRGRMDVTVQTRDYVYILELKVDKTAEEALQQIEDKRYAAPFAADPRKLFKIGVCFSSEERGIKAWKIRE
ncbi:MAG: PD-(D/E)XK nuclease domain-containing protein, partial [Bacteroidales bacterium]|nr:PD-(D/E)XK nuclease domain-containing protein [Bacteroidales bacterium]